MSAFAMHAKTSAFAAGARVLSSQKKSNNNNNNNNRCERPFPVSVEIVGREICFFISWERSLPQIVRPYPIIISFLDFALLSVSFLPRVTIASHTHRIALTRMTMLMMMRVCSSRYTSSLRSSRARVFVPEVTARERFLSFSLLSSFLRFKTQKR